MLLRNTLDGILCHSHLKNSFRATLPLLRSYSNNNNNESSLTEVKQSFIEKERKQEYSSILKTFSSKKSQFLELHRINPLTISPQRFREWKESVKRRIEIEQQKYIVQRHSILGCDLATAHFIVYRGGKVKFCNSDKWIELDKEEENCPELPSRFVRGLFLHSIDASNTNIRYEGLCNLINLTRLKWLSFRNCKHVDDWFLDRISGEFSNTLEYLDISGCSGVTENGLTCIYRLRNLKTLKINNNCDTRTFEYMCLLLEDNMPDLSIEGVQYIQIESSE